MKTKPKNNSKLKADFAKVCRSFLLIVKKEIRETKEYYADYNRKLHIQRLEKKVLKKLMILLKSMHKAGFENEPLVEKAHRAIAVLNITLRMQHKVAGEKKKAHSKAAKLYKKSKNSLEEISREIYEKEKMKLKFS